MDLNIVMQMYVQGLKKNALNNDNNQIKSLNTQNWLHISTTWITPDPNPNPPATKAVHMLNAS